MFEEEVDTGIALLHEKAPGWYQRIDLENLNLGSPYNCVLAQIYENCFSESLKELGFIYYNSRVNGMTPADYGFAISDAKHPGGSFSVLTEVWKARILALRSRQDKAYYLWEEAGRPDGQAEHFWHLAGQQS